MTTDADISEVLGANAAFYEAFEGQDLDAMSDVWEHSERVTCVHPGWMSLTGWGRVSASWYAIFDGPQQLQFIVTDIAAQVVGDMAWVTCNENLIDGGATQTVAATNIFIRSEAGWRLVHHQGTPVLQRPANAPNS